MGKFGNLIYFFSYNGEEDGEEQKIFFYLKYIKLIFLIFFLKSTTCWIAAGFM